MFGYIALSDPAPNIVSFQNALNELNIEQTSILIHHENGGAIEWAEPVSAKHISCRGQIDTRHQFSVNWAETGKIDLVKTPTASMVTNVLIKSFASIALEM